MYKVASQLQSTLEECIMVFVINIIALKQREKMMFRFLSPVLKVCNVVKVFY